MGSVVNILGSAVACLNLAIIASRKINTVVRDITEARIDGKPLSNYEKFLWAYQFVTDRVYTEEGTNQDPSISRNLVSVLSSDKIVCVGFASMLCTILTRLGIPCAYQSEISFDPSANIYVNHATCAIRIDDAIYIKHGIYDALPICSCATATEPVVCRKRSHHNEKSENHN